MKLDGNRNCLKITSAEQFQGQYGAMPYAAPSLSSQPEKGKKFSVFSRFLVISRYFLLEGFPGQLERYSRGMKSGKEPIVWSLSLTTVGIGQLPTVGRLCRSNGMT